MALPPDKTLNTITVTIQRDSDGESLCVTALPENTILETLETNNVTVQYHCRDGFCGACRCKLESGEVQYTTDPLAFIDDDEILPCVTKPLTDIEIES